MTQNANQLVGTPVTQPAYLRYLPTSVLPKSIAAISGAPTLARLLPMAYNTTTDLWVVWTNGGANGTGTVKGFLAQPHETSATDETLCPMMLAGSIHFDDIPVPSGETSANLKTALRSTMRQYGIEIQGLDLVR